MVELSLIESSLNNHNHYEDDHFDLSELQQPLLKQRAPSQAE